MSISLFDQQRLIDVLEVIQNLPANKKDEGNKIEIPVARRAKASFRTFMQQLGIDAASKGLTLSVNFGGSSFIDWLKDLQDCMSPVGSPPPEPTVDELRIVFARYTDEFMNYDAFNDENVGRLTVLLWPYKNHQPAHDATNKAILPFDLGGLYP